MPTADSPARIDSQPSHLWEILYTLQLAIVFAALEIHFPLLFLSSPFLPELPFKVFSLMMALRLISLHHHKFTLFSGWPEHWLMTHVANHREPIDRWNLLYAFRLFTELILNYLYYSFSFWFTNCSCWSYLFSNDSAVFINCFFLLSGSPNYCLYEVTYLLS